MKPVECQARYGWEKAPDGRNCRRKRPQKEEKAYHSGVALEMPEQPNISLKEHQTRVGEKLKEQKGLIVYHGLGSGKTLTAIHAAEEYGGAIVITPASLQDNFQKELDKYGAKGKYDVYSYEKFMRDKPDTSGRMLIADEAHRLRNTSTQSYKSVAEGAEKAEKVLLLTATPLQNKPHELSPLVNIAAGVKVLPLSEQEFKKQFIGKKDIPFWKRPFVPANLHSIDSPKNLTEFNERASKYVDYYLPTQEGYPSVSENTVEVPMTRTQRETYRLWEAKLDPVTRYKIQKNLPLDKKEFGNLNVFINAQRQLSNTEAAFTKDKKNSSPKTIEIADRIQMGEGKSLVYSNYLDSGIYDLSSELEERRIPYRVFTGKLNRKEKDEIIADYNNDKFKVLIVSSAGGEGLDLKKTRQVHIMEPHWNEEKIAQVMGRAIRYQSHAGLPPSKQKVEVYRYISIFPKNLIGIKSSKKTADEYLTELSRTKKQLNEQFLEVLRGDSEGEPCGKGWISKDKKCQKSKEDRSAQREKNKKKTLADYGVGLAIGGTMGLTAAAILYGSSDLPDPEKPWEQKKGYRIAYDVARKFVQVQGVSLPQKDSLSIKEYPQNRAEYSFLAKGGYGEVFISPDKKEVIKESLPSSSGSMMNSFIYSSAHEALASDLAESANIPSVKVWVVPVEEVSEKTKGKINTGASIQSLAKGVPAYDAEKPDFLQDEDFDIRLDAMYQKKKIKNIFTHPDIAKIVALDCFTGNRDRHMGNFFFNEKTNSFTAIDNGLAFSGTAGKELLNSLKALSEAPPDWDELNARAFKETLSSLLSKNTEKKIKSKLLGYYQLEKGDSFVSSLYKKTDRINKIEENLRISKGIVEEMDRLLQKKTKTDSEGKPCGKGWISKDKKCNPRQSSSTARRNPHFSRWAESQSPYAKNLQIEKDRIRHKIREQGIILDSQTGEVIYRSKEESPLWCEITEPEKLRGNVFVHNHPTFAARGVSNSFSPADINMACEFGIKEIWAVNERYEYKITPPRQGWNSNFKEQVIRPSFIKNYEAQQKDAIQKVRSGEIELNWQGKIISKDYDFYHGVWENVARETGMNYARTEVKNDAETRVDKQPSLVEQQSMTILSRAYPSRISNLKIEKVSGEVVKGLFLAQDKKGYDFTIDLKSGTLDYSLNNKITPRPAFREDARKKDPDCTIGIPCKGERGVGCVSRNNKCRVRLNRLISPSEKVIMQQTLSTVVDVQAEKTYEEQLKSKTFRELREIAKDAGVTRINYETKKERTKAEYVAILNKLKEMEEQGGETDFARTLSRRSKEIYIKPINLEGQLLTKEQVAQAKEKELQRKRRVNTAKKALGVLFPGAAKVVDEFAKAASVEDIVVASILAGVVAFKVYGTSKSQYEANYQKTVTSQGKNDIYGSGYVPERITRLQNAYNGDRFSSKEEADAFVREEFGVGLPAKATKQGSQVAASSDYLKRLNNLGEAGASKQSDLAYQVEAKRQELTAAYEKEKAKKEEEARKAQNKFETLEEIKKRAIGFSSDLEQERADLKAIIDTHKPGDTVTAKSALLEKSGNLEKIRTLRSSPLDSAEEALLDQEKQRLLQGQPNITDYALKSQLTLFEDSLRSQRVLNELKKRNITTISYEEAVESYKALDNMIRTNVQPHADGQAREATKAQVAAQDKQKELANVESRWRPILDDKKAILQLAKKAIDEQKLKGGVKPLLPDLGKVEPDKMTKYQAWVYANYVNYAKGKEPFEVNQDIRDGKLDLSLDAFKAAYPPVFVIGSQSGSADEAIKFMQNNPKLKHKLFIGINPDIPQSPFDSEKTSGWAYINRMGAFARKGLSAANRIPGFNPDKPSNRDGADIAAALVAAHRLGLDPQIITHGVGGNKLREAFDIIENSNDPQALDRFSANKQGKAVNSRILIFGSPKIGDSTSSRVNKLENMYHSDNDFMAKTFYYGVNKRFVPEVKNPSYKGYLSSPAVQKLIEDLFR